MGSNLMEEASNNSKNLSLILSTLGQFYFGTHVNPLHVNSFVIIATMHDSWNFKFMGLFHCS